jgi:hypothetical protein
MELRHSLDMLRPTLLVAMDVEVNFLLNFLYEIIVFRKNNSENEILMCLLF